MNESGAAPGTSDASAKPFEEAERRAHLGELENLGSRQIRLVVWLPALMLLYTLLVAIWLHLYLNAAASDFPAELQQRAEADSQRALLVGILGALIAACVGGLVAYTVVRPLRQLRASMEQVARGDLSSTNIAANLGELESLGLTFNQMVGQLQNVFLQRDRQMREAAIGSVVTLDSRGRVLATDDFFARVLSINPDRLRGLEFVEAFSRQIEREPNRVLLDSIRQLLSEAESGRTATATARYLPPGESQPRLLSIRSGQLESASDNGPSSLLDIRDLTSLRGFYEEMQRADRLAAVGTLATGIAHEVRNPLASIRAISQLLREDLSPGGSDTSQDYLGRIERDVDRLDRLVRSIMEFANQEEMPPTHVDINTLLQHVYETAAARAPVAEGTKIEVDWALDANLPIIYADEHRLSQALLNLFINALEELCDAGGRMCVTTHWNEKLRSRPVGLRISNTAAPIPAEVRERLFEPFYTTKPNGTGLGLPITYQIIVSQGGLLDVSSAEGMVHFDIRLPVSGRQSLAYSEGVAVSLYQDPLPAPDA